MVSGLGFEAVKERLLGICERDEGTRRALAFYLADVADRKLFEEGGHSSAVHFAEAQLEMNARRARELIQVGRELAGLHLVDDAFFAGEIGWTKVLLLLRVVQVSTQQVWIDFAREASCRELDEEVRRCRPGELPGEGSRIGLDAGSKTVTAKLDDKTFAMFEQARAYFIERSGREDMTDAEVLIALTKKFAVDHPDHDPERFEDELEPLAYEDRNHDEVPTETRESVMARDRHRCRNCHSYRDPQVHHIEHRQAGGSNDPTNLVVLCRTCHGLTHRAKLHIRVDRPNLLTFLSATGHPVTRSGGRPPSSP